MWCLPGNSAIDSDADACGVWIVWYKQKIVYIRIQSIRQANFYYLCLHIDRPYCLHTDTDTDNVCISPCKSIWKYMHSVYIWMAAPIAHMAFLLRLMLLANAHAHSIVVTLTWMHLLVSFCVYHLHVSKHRRRRLSALLCCFDFDIYILISIRAVFHWLHDCRCPVGCEANEMRKMHRPYKNWANWAITIHESWLRLICNSNRCNFSSASANKLLSSYFYIKHASIGAPLPPTFVLETKTIKKKTKKQFQLMRSHTNEYTTFHGQQSVRLCIM